MFYHAYPNAVCVVPDFVNILIKTKSTERVKPRVHYGNHCILIYCIAL